MKSTAHRPKCNPPCSKRCRNARSPSATNPTRCPSHFSCSPPKTRSTRKEPINSPKLNSTASSSRSPSAIQPKTRNSRFSNAWRLRPSPTKPNRSPRQHKLPLHETRSTTSTSTRRSASTSCKLSTRHASHHSSTQASKTSCAPALHHAARSTSLSRPAHSPS